MKSRLQISQIENNVSPVEKIRVGPGIGKGYTSGGFGGFQQTNIADFAKPKSMDELRSKINQKESYFQIPFQAPPKSTDKRGVITPFAKNKPEKTYLQTEDNLFKTTGAIVKESGRPEQSIKITARPDLHVEYQGGAKMEYMKGNPDDDYGKENILVYNNSRQETQTKTVVSNITNNIKAFISPIMDTLKYTLKEYMIDAPRAVGNSSAQIPKKQTLYNPDEAMKTTVKETLIMDSDILNLNAPDKTYSALHDEAKTTVKETLVHDSDILNLNALDKTYSALHDEAKTTVKETLIHDGEHINLKGAYSSSYVYHEDKMKKTMKETLPVQDTVRNIGKSQYRVSLYDPDKVVKRTTKETTIKGKSEYGFIGGILNGLIGGYATKDDIELKITNKQFTSDTDEYGIAGATTEFRPRNRDAEENAEIDGTREQQLIEAGHTPNPGGKNIPIDKKDINMKSNKLIQDSLSQRSSGNINIIYQSSPEIDDCVFTRDKENKNAFSGRLDGGILESLKHNDLNIGINPIR